MPGGSRGGKRLGRTSNINFICVSAIIRHSVLDHFYDGLRISSSIMRQTLNRAYIPAIPRTWGIRIDDWEAVGVGQGGVLGVGEVGISAASTI